MAANPAGIDAQRFARLLHGLVVFLLAHQIGAQFHVPLIRFRPHGHHLAVNLLEALLLFLELGHLDLCIVASLHVDLHDLRCNLPRFCFITPDDSGRHEVVCHQAMQGLDVLRIQRHGGIDFLLEAPPSEIWRTKLALSAISPTTSASCR